MKAHSCTAMAAAAAVLLAMAATADAAATTQALFGMVHVRTEDWTTTTTYTKYGTPLACFRGCYDEGGGQCPAFRFYLETETDEPTCETGTIGADPILLDKTNGGIPVNYDTSVANSVSPHVAVMIADGTTVDYSLKTSSSTAAVAWLPPAGITPEFMVPYDLGFLTCSTTACKHLKVGGTWTTKNAMGSARQYSFAAQTSPGHVWIMGGQVGTDVVDTTEYFMKDVWLPGPTLPVALMSGTAVAINPEKVFVFGGEGSGGPNAQTSMYDVPTNTFATKTNMLATRERINMAGVAYVQSNGDTVVLALGGYQYSAQSEVALADKYNVESNTWTIIPNLAFSFRTLSNVIHSAGSNYIIMPRALSKTLEYDAATNTLVEKETFATGVKVGAVMYNSAAP